MRFHRPEEENGYLSNWYPSVFQIHGKPFSSTEQYMMYEKAVRFKDNAMAEKILTANDVETIRALGRQVSGYNEKIWNGMRQILIYEGLLAKFSQNEALKKQLKGRGDAILAECA